MLMDVHQRGNLRFPQSLPEFQRLFPDDAACAGYLEKARWSDGFVCPHCQAAGEPFRFANRPGVLRCRKCRRDTGLTVGTVMARSHTPLSVWFWSAYLVSSQTPGMSAVQLRRQLGLSRGSTLHVVGVGNNRIGKVRSIPAPLERSARVRRRPPQVRAECPNSGRRSRHSLPCRGPRSQRCVRPRRRRGQRRWPPGRLRRRRAKFRARRAAARGNAPPLAAPCVRQPPTSERVKAAFLSSRSRFHRRWR